MYNRRGMMLATANWLNVCTECVNDNLSDTLMLMWNTKYILFSQCTVSVTTIFFLVSDLFSECFSNSEDRAFTLLVRNTRCWNKLTILNLATEADAKCFVAHDGVQVRAHLFCISMHLTAVLLCDI